MASDCAPQHMPKIILGALLLHTLDIKMTCLIVIFKLQQWIYRMVEFLFTEDNNSVDSEELSSECLYDVRNSNMLNN